MNTRCLSRVLLLLEELGTMSQNVCHRNMFKTGTLLFGVKAKGMELTRGNASLHGNIFQSTYLLNACMFGFACVRVCACVHLCTGVCLCACAKGVDRRFALLATYAYIPKNGPVCVYLGINVCSFA